MYTCRLCKKKFKSVLGLTTHLKRSHNNYNIHEYYDKFLKKKNEGFCKFCGNKTEYVNLVRGYKDVCKNTKCHHKKSEESFLKKHGVKCSFQLKESQEKARKTCITKYGVDYASKNPIFQENRKKTNLKKYGREHYTQTEEYKEKTKKHSQENFGVDHYLGAKEIRDKIKKTNKEKRGVENVFSCKEVQETIAETNLKNYGVQIASQSDIVKKKQKETYRKNHGAKGHLTPEQRKKQQKSLLRKKYEELKNNSKFTELVKPLFDFDNYIGYSNIYPWECLICHEEFSDNLLNQKIPRCPKCNPPSTSYSFIEKEIYNFVNEHISCEENKRFYFYKNSYYELDIYIPEIALGIELNGNYYHSELVGKDKKYHIDKTNFFKEKGVQVIHIFESEWKLKQDIIESIILSKIGKIKEKIYARKCDIKEIPFKQKKEFLEKNHIQGVCNSFLNIGLYYNAELVSLMTFSKSRYNKNYDYELVRFCNKINTTVVGGFSKLLKHFEKRYKGILVSYADLRFSFGNVYEKNNFTLNNISKPNYFYFHKKDKLQLLSRIQFQKHKLKNILENFNDSLTEWENMKNNDYSRIWDCGNLVYIKKII